jgi:tetratricopeptide (TPR) repeat protein
MSPTLRRAGRRLALLALASALLAIGPTGQHRAVAQISGIERGGGVDRPYVPVRKRLNNPKPSSKPKPTRGSRTPPTPVDASMIPISDEAEKHYDAGRKAYDVGNLEVAIKEFENAIRLESKYVDALIDLGDAYFDRANLDDAVEAYRRALAVDKGNLDAEFRLGRASYARRDYDTALAEYNSVLKVRPDDPEAIYNIALTNKALKRFDDAIPYFEKAITARNKPFPEARINLSRCYYELGKLAEAEAEARKAIDEIGPDQSASANAWYALATALAKKPDLPGAADALEHAIAVCKDCPGDMVSRFYLPLALVYEARGDREHAADAYERFLQLAPFMPDYQIQEIRERIGKLRHPSGA